GVTHVLPITDVGEQCRHFRLVPTADSCTASKGVHARGRSEMDDRVQCFVRRSSLMEIESAPSTRLMMCNRTSSECRAAPFGASASLLASGRLAALQWKSTMP